MSHVRAGMIPGVCHIDLPQGTYQLTFMRHHHRPTIIEAGIRAGTVEFLEVDIPRVPELGERAVILWPLIGYAVPSAVAFYRAAQGDQDGWWIGSLTGALAAAGMYSVFLRYHRQEKIERHWVATPVEEGGPGANSTPVVEPTIRASRTPLPPSRCPSILNPRE